MSNGFKRWQLLFHALPNRMPGKGRLARLLLGRKLTAENVRIFDGFGNTYRVPNLAEPIAFWLFVNGMYEESTWIFLKENLYQGSVFLDIGANIGAISIPAAGLVGKKGLVVSVEGSPVIVSYLKHNIAKNMLSNVQLIESIVSAEKNQKLAFYEAPSNKFGMGSMGPQFDMKPVMLTATTVNSLLKKVNRKVDVMKVDVEGAEALVFQGATETLIQKNPPLIIFEFCDWAEKRMPGVVVGDAQRFLMKHGYSIYILKADGKLEEKLKTPILNGFAMLVGVPNDN